MNDAASKLFTEQMGQPDNEYNKLFNAEKVSFALDTISVIFFLMIIIVFVIIFGSSLEDGERVPSMPPLEGDKKLKERKRNKIINSEQTIIQTFNIIGTNKSWK